MDEEVNSFTFFLKLLGVMTILLPLPFIIFIPSLRISSRPSLVAGSKSEGNSYVPIIMDRTSDSSDKYRNQSPRRDFMIGALWARVKRILHLR